MIRREELQEEIRRYQLDPVTYASIAKLADLITVYNYLFPEPDTATKQYSESADASEQTTIPDARKNGESEFLRAAYNMDPDDFMRVMDELMDTLNVIQPRLYDGVMRKLF